LVSKSENELFVLFSDFGTHRHLSGFLNVGFDIIRNFFAQVNIGSLCSDTDESDNLGVHHVVLNDGAQFWEVEPVPFSESHHVVIDFLVQVLVEGNGLDDHGINLIGGELQFESTESVGKTHGHFSQSFGGQTVDQTGDVESDASHELEDSIAGVSFDFQVIGDQLGSLFVGDGELILNFLGDNILLQELLQGFGHLSIEELDSSTEDVLGVFTRLKSLELDDLLQFVFTRHVLAEIINFVELLLLLNLEESESGWSFEQE